MKNFLLNTCTLGWVGSCSTVTVSQEPEIQKVIDLVDFDELLG